MKQSKLCRLRIATRLKKCITTSSQADKKFYFHYLLEILKRLCRAGWKTDYICKLCIGHIQRPVLYLHTSIRKPAMQTVSKDMIAQKFLAEESRSANLQGPPLGTTGGIKTGASLWLFSCTASCTTSFRVLLWNTSSPPCLIYTQKPENLALNLDKTKYSSIILPRETTVRISRSPLFHKSVPLHYLRH